MRCSKKLAVSVAMLTLHLLPVQVAAVPRDLREPAFISQVKASFQQIYNLDYDQAIQSLAVLKDRYPRHPAPPLYMATSIWLRELLERQELDLDHFIAPSHFDRPTGRKMPDKDRESFFRLIEESQQLSQAILKTSPGHQDARYFLGSSYGILGSFAITIDRSKQDAFDYVKKTYKYHHALVEENPEYFDAYLSVGMYEYVVGSLPWYVKWLASLVGNSGSRERGFQYLGIAAEKGALAGEDARILQMVLYVREGDYLKALARVKELQALAPRNFVLYFNEAYNLEKLGRPKEAVGVYQKLLEMAEAGRPNFNKIPLDTIRYAVGEKLLTLQAPKPALEQFEKAAQSARTPERERTLSFLRAGQTLDLLNQRNQALKKYQQVLKLPEYEESHSEARRFLKRPYSLREPK